MGAAHLLVHELTKKGYRAWLAGKGLSSPAYIGIAWDNPSLDEEEINEVRLQLRPATINQIRLFMDRYTGKEKDMDRSEVTLATYSRTALAAFFRDILNSVDREDT